MGTDAETTTINLIHLSIAEHESRVNRHCDHLSLSGRYCGALILDIKESFQKYSILFFGR